MMCTHSHAGIHTCVSLVFMLLATGLATLLCHTLFPTLLPKLADLAEHRIMLLEWAPGTAFSGRGNTYYQLPMSPNRQVHWPCRPCMLEACEAQPSPAVRSEDSFSEEISVSRKAHSIADALLSARRPRQYFAQPAATLDSASLAFRVQLKHGPSAGCYK